MWIKNNNSTKIYTSYDTFTWTDYTAGNTIQIPAGKKLYLKSNTGDWGGGDQKTLFLCKDGQFNVGGNLASLIVGDDFEEKGASQTSYSFLNLFKNHTNLIHASQLVLPMMSVGENAYKSLFDGCINLLDAPALPAQTLGKTCYRNMFLNCSNLENAPVLAATKLAQGCYQRMFYGCKKINYIKMLGKENYRDDCFFSDGTNWCGNVSATGELWLDSTLNPVTDYTTSWKKIVPAGWTVKYVGIDDN